MPLTGRQLFTTTVAVGVAFGLGVGAAVLVLDGNDVPTRSVLSDVDGAGASPATSATPPPATGVTSPPTATASPTTEAPLTEAVLRSAMVPSVCSHPAGTLRDGRLPGIPEGEGEVVLDDVALGDLDGDGVDEAAVVLGCSTGNSVATEVLVYESGPRLLGRVPVEEGLDSEVRAHQLDLSPGRLEVSGYFQDADDPRVSPTGRVARAYLVRDGRITRIPAVGVDTASRLTGHGLGSIRVGDSYEQLARATGLPGTLETLEEGDPHAASCAYVGLEGSGVGVMGGSGTVGSVVVSVPGVVSKSGVGVGASEQEVLDVYGARAERVENTYSPVDDVVVPAGSGRIVRFEFSDDRRVRTMHGGFTEFASLVEGCA